ncbi:Flavin-containing monooxygenase FMO GS-OX1 [Phytophthora pseudosyringae]|uniref:Flavin-containing monooxygenase FMO GS-OX1 n=1 Tax=Phytophthora pseudosyringae TaxID=221518 RepID=A0A8T1WBS8_9STRA|nr:Flavin-containing monooxygenase FMO GS-OX1 [Phytophthora pseudosyringae]
MIRDLPGALEDAHFQFGAMTQLSTRTVRVGIIGGGAAGIIAAKSLREAGHDVVVFEKSSHLGGVWKYDDAADAPSSVLYKSLHTNVPTSTMQLKDFPFRAGLPSFPSHADVLEYLQSYTKNFAVDEFVRTDTKVTGVSKVGDQWKISVESKEKGGYDEQFDRLVVANGHHNKEWQAPITGIENYRGVVSHARSYRTPEPYRNKRVLIIGRGPSGQDISLELAKSGAKEVHVAALDFDASFADEKDTRVLKPTVDYIAEDGTVVFTDGSSIAAPDEIMHCTGYLYTVNDLFPSELLFSKTAVPNSMSDEVAADLRGATKVGTAVAPLYKHVFSIKDPTAVFIGLPVSIPPFQCFELQSRWVARVFDESVALPPKENMYEDFYQTVRKINGSARKLHSVGEAYISELGAYSGTAVDVNIHDMYEDAAYLRVNFPHDFRSAEFSQDPDSGKWVRRYKPSADPAADLVKVF